MQPYAKRLGLGRAVTLAATLFAAVVSAEEPLTPTDSLGWVVEPGAVDCPAEETLRQRLVERMGRDPFAAPAAPRFGVRLQQTNGKYSAKVFSMAEGVSTTRSIGGDANSCSEVVDAVALTLSLLLEANPVVTAPSQPKSDRQTVEQPPAARPPPPAVCQKTVCPACSRKDRATTGWFGVGILASKGDLPNAAEGAALAMGLPLAGAWEVTAGAAFLGAERTTEDWATMSLSLTEGWVGVGHSVQIADGLRWRGDFGPLVGVLHSYPLAPLRLTSGDYGYWGLRGASFFEVQVGGAWGLAGGLSLEMRAKRWQFRVQDPDLVVWQQRWLGTRAEMRVTWAVE